MKRALVSGAMLLSLLAGSLAAASPQEFRTKVDKVRRTLKEKKLSGLLISRPCNFAWLTGGGDNSTSPSAEAGSGSLMVTPKEVYLVGTADRTKRLLDQELRGLKIRSMAYYWHEELENNEPLRLARGLAPGRIGSDLGLPDTEPMEETLRAWRLTMDREEIKRYRVAGRLAAEACEAAAGQAASGMTEGEIAGLAARELWNRGLVPLAVAVAVDENARKYRENVTRNGTLERLLRVQVRARKGGLTVATTRTVFLGAPPDDLKDRQQTVERLFASCLNNLQPGAKLQELYTAAISFFKELNLANEWRTVPLGAATGYREREHVITPSDKELVLENQPFVFFPSLDGVRVEETVLATAAGTEILTATGQWPVREIEMAGKKFQVPGILVKKP
jgi:Xaa-Pro aminopeptidase